MIKDNGALWANSAVLKEWTVDKFLKISYTDGIYGNEKKNRQIIKEELHLYISVATENDFTTAEWF